MAFKALSPLPTAVELAGLAGSNNVGISCAMPRVDFDLPCRTAGAFREAAAYFSVEAGSTWGFLVGVKILLWIGKIARRMGLDGSDSLLSSGRGDSRNRPQCRCESQRNP